MKKVFLLLPLAFVSMTAYSQSYIVAGYGVGSVSHDEAVNFTDTTTGTVIRSLKPDNSDSVWGVALGYRSESNMGLEIGYQQFETDYSIEQFVKITPEFAKIENNWNADVKAKRLTIKPVYFLNLNEKMTIKSGLGLTYTEYKITGNSYEETEHLVDIDTYKPIANVTNPGERSKKEFGVIASLAVDYNVWKGVTVGVEGNVGVDSMATTAQLFGTVGYNF